MMTFTIPTDVIVKREKARAVFGDVVLDDDDDSLRYSPSESSPYSSSSPSSFKVLHRNTLNSNTEESSEDGDFNLKPKILTTMTADEIEEENIENDNSTYHSIDKNRIEKRRQQQQQRNIQILNHRSPLRPDLVKKTQEAINRASSNLQQQSIIAAGISRQDSFRQKLELVSKSRREWKEEKAAVAAFYQEAHMQRIDVLRAKRDLSSQLSHARLRMRQEYRRKHLNAIEQESHFASAVFRDHQKSLRQQHVHQRRLSNESKARTLDNHRQGEQKMKATRIKEDQFLYEERNAASVALRESHQQAAANRRHSFAFRAGDARRIRMLFLEQEKQRKLQERESFELNVDGHKDALEAQRKLEEERRNSLAARWETHSHHRREESKQKSYAMKLEHNNMQLKWEGERDANAYRDLLKEERRRSLELRNRESARQRKEASEHYLITSALNHADMEIKLLAERDVDEYRKRLEIARRESLAGRNAAGRRIRENENLQAIEQKNAEHVSYELKWASERDMETYRQSKAKERRDSLKQRNKEGLRQRNEEQEKRNEQRAVEHYNYELKWDDERRVRAYLNDVQRERSEYLKHRNKERSDHAKLMKELKELVLESESQSYNLKWEGENDAKAYQSLLAEERRQSFQRRGEQILHNRKEEADERAKYLQQLHEDELFRAGDQKDVQSYNNLCAAQHRAFLQYRGKEARIQSLEEEDRMFKAQHREHMDFEMETQARSDVAAYVENCKQHHRLSLAFRAKEKRRHAKWIREQAENDREARSRDVRDRLLDRRYVELAKQQERARNAMDSIRHAGCSFSHS